MIDKTKRLEKEQAKAKTKKRIYVEVDPENYDYFPMCVSYDKKSSGDTAILS